jgi:glycosyltransferase involved in cell wall biosynthesis
MPGPATIDVLIPVRDGASFLAQAIESVLAQTLPPDRVIVIDDGSNDGSATTAESFGAPITVLREPPRGAAAALNAGLAESNAQLVAFLDADDLWLPERLELQTAVLKGDPAIEIVFGHLTEFLDGDVQGVEARTEPVPGVLKSTALVRRTTLDAVGHFDASYSVVDFAEWHSRSQAAGVVDHVVPEIVARRRVHGANVTMRRRETLNAEYLRLARAAVTRRRAPAQA